MLLASDFGCGFIIFHHKVVVSWYLWWIFWRFCSLINTFSGTGANTLLLQLLLTKCGSIGSLLNGQVAEVDWFMRLIAGLPRPIQKTKLAVVFSDLRVNQWNIDHAWAYSTLSPLALWTISLWHNCGPNRWIHDVLLLILNVFGQLNVLYFVFITDIFRFFFVQNCWLGVSYNLLDLGRPTGMHVIILSYILLRHQLILLYYMLVSGLKRVLKLI